MDTLRDHVITEIVRSRLGEDQETCGQTIDVSVADGDLFLIGWCDSENQRISAVRIAKGAYGVRAVIDNIRVRRIASSI
jgi:osmotically-inducible protein OsmY